MLSMILAISISIGTATAYMNSIDAHYVPIHIKAIKMKIIVGDKNAGKIPKTDG